MHNDPPHGIAPPDGVLPRPPFANGAPKPAESGNASAAGTCLLLVLPLPIFGVGGRWWLDSQACNGLRLWLTHFDRVILCLPAQSVASPPPATSDVRHLLPTARLEIEPLPSAYTPLRFLRSAVPVGRRLGTIIDRATHLQFAIGGAFGDWGAMGALIAARRGRAAAVWTDRVEWRVMDAEARRRSGWRRAYHLLVAQIARRLERAVIRHADLGLFHGLDTFEAYAPLSRNPHVVHDIHLSAAMRIAPEALDAKLAGSRDRPLRIVYGGRAHPDKGPLDWVETLIRADALGVRFEATWFGDGPDLAAARARAAEAGLGERIHLPGALHDRELLMARFRQADLFLFCHKTAESPRCLVEALLSGTPIIGYRSAYAAGLLAANGGGVLTAPDPAALAMALAGIARDPARLDALSRAAARDGYPFTDEEVFRHRADLIKTLA